MQAGFGADPGGHRNRPPGPVRMERGIGPRFGIGEGHPRSRTGIVDRRSLEWVHEAERRVACEQIRINEA
ncbi:MAG: hypothetical protein CMJ52_10270 [Planctomycetaceae bacterium]|nr:hypothetical protein [Planctomycetaceae bacterium]